MAANRDNAVGRLMIFAKYPRTGAVKTRLAPMLGAETAADLYRAFLLDAVQAYAALRPTIEPVVYVADPADLHAMRDLLAAECTAARPIEVRAQRGEALGDRLIAAFAEAFADGVPVACAIGTDHPTLPIEFVGHAFAATNDAEAEDAHAGEETAGGAAMVIGPAEDGGYYLLALRSEHPELFLDMPYSTPALYEATLDAAQALGVPLVELPMWYDVDDAATLLRLWDDRDMLAPESRTAQALVELPGAIAAMMRRTSINGSGG